MGICEKSNNKNSDFNHKNEFDEEVTNINFINYLFEDRFIDFVGNKYKLNDPVFKSFHKDDRNILEKSFKSKKMNFKYLWKHI